MLGQGEKMGIQDRDWYKEEYKRKMAGQSHRPFSRGSRPAPDLSAYERAFASKAKTKTAIKLVLLFLLLCLAIYGALSIVQHLKQPLTRPKAPVTNHEQTPSNEQQRSTPKPAVRYL
jgi:hypothetical protein